jgi:hypothetical protein
MNENPQFESVAVLRTLVHVQLTHLNSLLDSSAQIHCALYRCRWRRVVQHIPPALFQLKFDFPNYKKLDNFDPPPRTSSQRFVTPTSKWNTVR